MDLDEAVLNIDLNLTRKLLDSTEVDVNRSNQNGGTVLHSLLHCVSSETLLASPQRRGLIYMLTNAGINVNATDLSGDSVLHLAVRKLDGDLEICEPLLQAGANMYMKNKEGEEPLQQVTASSTISAKVKDLFKKYSPGLWEAVEQDELLSVRKLVNLWCRVDIKKEGKTLKLLALEKGTEHIIRLIKEIEPAMKLAHSVLAEDVKTVKTLFAENSHINTEFKNLGDMGATPLFYAILQNNLQLVNLLCQHGAKLDAIITLEEEDIPILFAALNSETDPEIIKTLILHKDESTFSLSALHYRGHHVLHHCIENSVSLVAVRHILRQGYSQLLTLRDMHNQCPRDVAVRLGKLEYVKGIDEAVHEWYLDSNSEHRKTLALMGYTHLREAEKDGVRACDVVQTMETSSTQAQFDTQLQNYQDQISRFVNAVECGEMDKVKSLIKYHSDHPDCFHTCLADCRAPDDGQPPLHKAVLRGHLEVVEYLVGAITANQKLDSVRDQALRTSLHYAYATQNNKVMINTLIDLGHSEFTMDKDWRSPLVFKDYQQHPHMRKLLDWHLHQMYNVPEPDPWSIKMPRMMVAPKPSKLNHHQHAQQMAAPLTPQQQLQWLQAQRMMMAGGAGSMAPIPAQTPQTPQTPPQQSAWMYYCHIL